LISFIPVIRQITRVADPYFETNEQGDLEIGADKIPYALVITISSQKARNLYDKILQRYPTILEPLRPIVEIPIGPDDELRHCVGVSDTRYASPLSTPATGCAAPGRHRKKVEMLFAHLKRILKLDRLRLRWPNGARDEFHLAATAQNLRKLAKLIPAPVPMPAS
jgi:hypothetical protein